MSSRIACADNFRKTRLVFPAITLSIVSSQSAPTLIDIKNQEAATISMALFIKDVEAFALFQASSNWGHGFSFNERSFSARTLSRRTLNASGEAASFKHSANSCFLVSTHG